MNSFPCLQTYDDRLHITEVAQNTALLAEIQQLLLIGDFYNGRATGWLNNETTEAFKRFKQSAYLEYPSILGKSTAKELLEIAGIGEHPQPRDAVSDPPVISQGKSLKLPTGDTVYCHEPIPGTRNFCWGEATKNGTRIPVTKDVVQHIIKVAGILETARTVLGDRKMVVTSWYRPPTVNRAVGGVPNSRHLIGDGVDFVVQGMNPLETFKVLNPWLGGKGGLGKSHVFVHLDARGYRARWDYGNA